MATGMAAFMQFDSIAIALLVAGASLTITTIVGIFATTWMTGRIANINSAAVHFAAVLGLVVTCLGHGAHHSGSSSSPRSFPNMSNC
jgi:predicted PurR-regulated permease PerM